MGDAETGLIESIYKGCKVCTKIPVGEVFIIERENVITKITRANTVTFEVDSYANVA